MGLKEASPCRFFDIKGRKGAVLCQSMESFLVARRIYHRLALEYSTHLLPQEMSSIRASDHASTSASSSNLTASSSSGSSDPLSSQNKSNDGADNTSSSPHEHSQNIMQRMSRSIWAFTNRYDHGCEHGLGLHR